LSITGTGFAPYSQDVDVRSAVPLSISISLKVAAASDVVTILQLTPMLIADCSTRSLWRVLRRR
jgi:hypothetical protein